MNKKVWTLTVTDDDIALIDAALKELPFKSVVMIINKLHAQLAEQQEKEKLEQGQE